MKKGQLERDYAQVRLGEMSTALARLFKCILHALLSITAGWHVCSSGNQHLQNKSAHCLLCALPMDRPSDVPLLLFFCTSLSTLGICFQPFKLSSSQ